MIEVIDREGAAQEERETGEPAREAAIEALTRLPFRIGRLVKEQMRGGPLTPPQMMMLQGIQELVGRQGGAHPGELAGRCYLSSPAVTAALDELVEKGYCVRAHSEADRRKVLVRLTTLGEASLATTRNATVAALREMLSDWDDQRMARMLTVLRELDAAATAYLDRGKA